MQDIKDRGTLFRQNEIVFSNRKDVVFYNDSQTGLKTIIAIHNTNCRPAIGDCRFLPYVTEDEALQDVSRLSRAMTYKTALANLNIGGGKSVIIGEPEKITTPELMKAFGCFIEKLNGMYIIGEDVGTSLEDMEQIHKVTKYVRGLKALVGVEIRLL